jgi:lamin tail-like protein
MVRALRVLVVAALTAVAFNVAAPNAHEADAASCVKIYRIYYDSPGADYGSNTSLNGEWIQLKNICSTNKAMSGFKFRDAANHWYTFGTYTLKAGAYVKVHTGKGTNTSTDRYQGRAAYVWNNDKDTAYLYNASSTLIRTCSYNSTAVDYKYC